MRNRISLAALLLTVPAFMAAQGPVNVGSLTFAPATNVAGNPPPGGRHDHAT